MEKPYATHASTEFNARLDAALDRLTRAVRRALNGNLVALLLGGGYGRGEGGVVLENGEERPYNDLDLFLVVRRPGAVPWQVLDAICRMYELELGVEVDFGRPLTVKDIRTWPRWLMWFDLLNGHRVLYGPPDILLEYAPESLQEPLPGIEATRLLLNRGAGLLWALRVVRGLEPSPDTDFIRRNFFKCVQAFGDAALIAHGQFTTRYRGRDRLLERVSKRDPEVAGLGLELSYRRALQFKFCPGEFDDFAPGEAHLHVLSRRWGEVFVHVECLRCGRLFSSLEAYTKWDGLREPGMSGPSRWPANLVRNGRLGFFSWRYPRERLYRWLPVLLGLTGRSAADWGAESAGFLRMWRRFN